MSNVLNITICVVLFKSPDVSRNFAERIVQSLSEFSDWEIIFFDNSPDDALSDLSRHGTYMHDPGNKGFSYGNNQAILAARYGNIALINPDVFDFSTDFWRRISLDVIGRDDVRFVRLVNNDGSYQDCVGDVTSLSRIWRPRRDYAAMRDVHPVGMGIMAFMLTTRNVIARVGLLDCDYPLYAEDMDWCQRAHRCGIPVLYDARFQLTHLGGASAADRWSHRQSLAKKYLAERIFIDKHRRGLGWIALRLVNWAKRRIRA